MHFLDDTVFMKNHGKP